MSRSALITGGSGYFGCLLRDRLLEQGWQVRVFDLVDADDRPEAVEFVPGDIRDAEGIRAVCAGADVVFHNVAQVPLAKNRDLFWSVNLDGTENLLAAVRDAGVRKLVHTSSSAIFGVPARNPVDEDLEPVPGEAYGAAKLAAEQRVRTYAAEHGIDATILRPRTILGHGRLGIFQILFDWVERGWNLPVLGRGDNVYQFVHADDLADACIRAAGRPGFAVYNVGAATFGTMRETLEALCRHAGSGSRVRAVPMAPAVWAMRVSSALGLSPLGPYHALMYGRSLYFDITRVTSDLAWKPAWSNEAMMCQSYDWYRDHRDEIQCRTDGSPHRSAVEQGILALVGRFL